jgi:hypothetical protein
MPPLGLVRVSKFSGAAKEETDQELVSPRRPGNGAANFDQSEL